MDEKELNDLPTIETIDGFVGIKFANSERLTRLTNYALAKAINILKGSLINEPLMVITVIENDEVLINDYSSGDRRTEAAKSIESLPSNVQAYALVATATIPINGANHVAIFLQVGERGHTEGYQFAQKYKAKGLFSAFARVEAPLLLRKVPQLLK